MFNKKIYPFLFLFLLVLFSNLPIILNPNLLLGKGNDLQEVFWPVFYFIKQQVLENHEFPLWNNLWFSGQPLLPDPQFSLFYPPHIIFLLLPTNLAFIISIIMHIFIGGIGTYLASKYGFKFSKITSLFIGLLYIFSPLLAGYIEAGHFGLVATTAWLPYVLLSLIFLSKNPSINWSILLAVSLSGIFYTHTLIFLMAVVSGALFFGFITFLQTSISRPWKVSIFYLTVGYILTFGLIAITLLPQLEWAKETTRFMLLEERDVYPKWLSPLDFLKSLFFPILYPLGISQIASEKWITIGILPMILAAVGFLSISKKIKLALVLFGTIILLIVLNNKSPLQEILLSQDFYVLMRVSTRIWPLVVITSIFLAGYGFERLLKFKKIILLIALLTFAELTFIYWSRITIPIPIKDDYISKEVYEFLKKDNDKFRVFCVNRCLSQQQAAIYNLELIEGYNTLQQKNYYKQAWQLTGKFWDYYTLAIPPMGIYTFEKIQPDALYLGLLNTKYIISPYEITDKNLVLKKQINRYFIYLNQLFAPRAFMGKTQTEITSKANIVKLTPNEIEVIIPDERTPHLVLSEVYSPGWNAYLNGKEQVGIQERPDTLRLIDIKPDTEFVTLKYEPETFKTGKSITLATVLILCFALLGTMPNPIAKLKK